MRRCAAGLAALLLAGAAPAARAGLPEPAPLQRVDVRERLGARVPLELPLRDPTGARAALGRHFDGEPVILVLGYYHCRMLCGRLLDGVADALAELEARRDAPSFRVVSVSIDPRDTPASARARRAPLLERLGWSASRWPFLVGEEGAARALAETVGFGYRYDADTDQYAHPAVLQVLSPDGRVAAYLYGVDFEADALAAALEAAAAGRSRSALDRVLVRCFRYVPALRRYAGELALFFRGGALAAVALSLAALLLALRRVRARGSRR